MLQTYEAAVQELYRTALGAFVAERKRLAGELKARGDSAGAKQLSKLPRPTISAWAVNQLYWSAPAEFEHFLELAQRVGRGDRDALTPHREQLARLRARAAELIENTGHSALDATLRRVVTNLSALAATGSFQPDPAGALSADRDPPGFDLALELTATATLPASAREPDSVSGSSPSDPARTGSVQPHTSLRGHSPRVRPKRLASQSPLAAERIEAERIEAERIEAERIEAERIEAERIEAERIEAERIEAERAAARRQELRRALEAELKVAHSELDTCQANVAQLRLALMEAEEALSSARNRVRNIEIELKGQFE